ncbi:MAG: DsbA family protein [Candidatus Yanofskybacteria bacterium]|nr:DsbA family protein [Candidatus Yanofskybacteria bacterium]
MDDIQIELAVQKEPESPKNWFDPSKFILPGAILIAAVLISGSIVFYSFNVRGNAGTADIKGEKVDVSVDDDPMLGNPKAKITLVEFSDFQCPFCRSFWRDTLPLIKSEYIDTGKVRFVYRDFPLSFHPGAMPAAQAAECAREQDKFWEMHDKIFSEQAKQGSGTIQFPETDIKKWASQISGLDLNKWNECIASKKYKSEVEKDLKDGTAYGVSGTPTVFINGKPVVGAQPFSAFKAEIDALLK